MDRIISLLAALVGLIALGGAILVHTNAETQRRELAGEIAELKAAASTPGAAAASRPATAAPGIDSTLASLQDRITVLEQGTRAQAAELAAASARLAEVSAEPAAKQVATAESPIAAPAPLVAAASPASSSGAAAATPAAVVAGGASKDCIPLGTRFMAQGGDNFALCKTKIVLKVAAVSDGVATVSGAGDVAVGASVPYERGCLLAVFSADISGFAEMRVTCQ